MTTQTKSWRRIGEHTYVREGPQTCTAVVGTDGVLVLGPGAPEGLAEVTDLPVRFTHRTVVDGAELLGHEDDPDAGVTFASVWAADLGDCYVEAMFPGRGASATQIVVVVPEDDVVVVGDLVTQPGPPAYGKQSWPLEWPETLDIVLGLTTPTSILVPGRGTTVDRDFVDDQREQIVGLAEQVNVLAQTGVTAEQASEQGTWPFPRETTRAALARAFDQWRP